MHIFSNSDHNGNCKNHNTNESQLGKMYLRKIASSEDSNQPANSHNVIWRLPGRILDSQGCTVSSCGQWRPWSDYSSWFGSPYVFSSWASNKLHGKTIISHLMTKPTKWHVCPAKTQISLGIRQVWTVFAVRMKKAWVLSFPFSAPRRLWAQLFKTNDIVS